MEFHLHLPRLLCLAIQKQGKREQEQEHLFIVHCINWLILSRHIQVMFAVRNEPPLKPFYHLDSNWHYLYHTSLYLLIPLHKYNDVEKVSFNVCTTRREWTKCWFRAVVRWFYWTNCCRSWREKDIRYCVLWRLCFPIFIPSILTSFLTFYTHLPSFLPSYLPSFLPSFHSILLSFLSLHSYLSLTDPSRSLLPLLLPFTIPGFDLLSDGEDDWFDRRVLRLQRLLLRTIGWASVRQWQTKGDCDWVDNYHTEWLTEWLTDSLF